MTTDTMPPHPRAVTRPRPQRPPDADRRAARVRPYHRHQEHHPSHQTRPVRPAGQVEPMRDRAVLERVLTGLRALNPQPTTPTVVQNTAQRRPTPPSLPPWADNSAATTTATSTPPTPVATSAGEAPAGSSVRSLLGRELMPLVRAVLARRPEAAQPAERVEPSPDSIRTQPLRVVEVTP